MKVFGQRQEDNIMIKIKNVNKILKKKTVLNGIDLSINEGDFILLRGHNGCGKTMLLRLICGLISPDEGSISQERELSFGVIIENPAFLLSETAKYNLKYLAAINKKVTDDEIDELLQQFGLYDVRNKKVRTFSLGMKQRLALVQAIMEKPNVLLLDEPFNAIDDSNLKMIFGLLDSYNEAGNTIIVASHGDYSSSCSFNRIITMSDGKIQSDEKISSSGVCDQP